MKKQIYCLVQQGGASTELYLHAHTTKRAAETDKLDCWANGAYATSAVFSIPASIATDRVFEAMQQAVDAAAELN